MLDKLDFRARTRRNAVIPVVTIEHPAHAPLLAKALSLGGLDIIEVTL